MMKMDKKVLDDVLASFWEIDKYTKSAKWSLVFVVKHIAKMSEIIERYPPKDENYLDRYQNALFDTLQEIVHMYGCLRGIDQEVTYAKSVLEKIEKETERGCC